MKRSFIIGYGGRGLTDFVRLLSFHGVRTVVDVRIQPNRAFMAVFAKTRSSDKGIERILGEAGIGHLS